MPCRFCVSSHALRIFGPSVVHNFLPSSFCLSPVEKIPHITSSFRRLWSATLLYGPVYRSWSAGPFTHPPWSKPGATFYSLKIYSLYIENEAPVCWVQPYKLLSHWLKRTTFSTNSHTFFLHHFDAVPEHHQFHLFFVPLVVISFLPFDHFIERNLQDLWWCRQYDIVGVGVHHVVIKNFNTHYVEDYGCARLYFPPGCSGVHVLFQRWRGENICGENIGSPLRECSGGLWRSYYLWSMV